MTITYLYWSTMDPLGEGSSSARQWGGSPSTSPVDERAASSISPLGPRPALPGEPSGHYRPPGPRTATADSSSSSSSHMQPRDAQTGPDQVDIERRARADSTASTSTAATAAAAAAAARRPAGPVYLKPKVVALDKNKRECFVRFNVETNMASYKHALYKNVSRSFADFQKYAEAVAANNPQSIVPALPLTQTSAPRDDDDDRLVKLAFQRWLVRVFDDVSLRRDDETRSFVTSEFGYLPQTKARRKVPSASSAAAASATSSIPGLKAVVAVGTSITSSSSSSYVDPDDELSVTKAAMTKLESAFLDVHKCVDKTAKARRAVATSLVELGEAWNNLASVEPYAPLSLAFKKMSIAAKRHADVGASHAASEQVTLADPMLYQSANARAARDTLACRDGVVDEHRHAAKTTVSRRKAIERLKGSANIKADRVDEALEELEDARRHEHVLAQRVAAISTHLAPSVRAHSKHAHEDVAQALLHYAQTNVTHESQLLKDLELLRPEIDAVDLPDSDGAVKYHNRPATAQSSASANSDGALVKASGKPASKNGTATGQQQQQQQAQKWKRVDARMAASMLSNGF